jgi:hypothetical protein
MHSHCMFILKCWLCLVCDFIANYSMQKNNSKNTLPHLKNCINFFEENIFTFKINKKNEMTLLLFFFFFFLLFIQWTANQIRGSASWKQPQRFRAFGEGITYGFKTERYDLSITGNNCNYFDMPMISLMLGFFLLIKFISEVHCWVFSLCNWHLSHLPSSVLNENSCPTTF